MSACRIVSLVSSGCFNEQGEEGSLRAHQLRSWPWDSLRSCDPEATLARMFNQKYWMSALGFYYDPFSMCTYIGSVVTLVSVCLYGVCTPGTPFYFMLSWHASYVSRAHDCRYTRLQEFFSFPQFPVCSKNVYRQCYIVNMVRTRKTGLFPL